MESYIALPNALNNAYGPVAPDSNERCRIKKGNLTEEPKNRASAKSQVPVASNEFLLSARKKAYRVLYSLTEKYTD